MISGFAGACNWGSILPNGSRVVGRTRELAKIHARLSAEPPGSVLLAGAAGIGKTTVLDAAAAEAAQLGFAVRRSRAAASESDLPFLGLVDLIGEDVSEFAADLPRPLRRALDVVLQRADPPDGGADSLAANLAVLEVLQVMADRQRVLLILDDVQWLDSPTRGVLGFAIRRLAGRQLSVVAAVRGADESSAASLLPEPRAVLSLGPLAEPEIADVVALRAGLMPTPGRAARLHRLSGGNPYLAVELARASAAVPSGVEDLPVPQRYRPVLAARLAGLSPAVRRTVLAAALLARPTTQTLARIGGPEGLAEAEAAGVLRLAGELIEFDHPLLAAASREEAGPAAVRMMHADLCLVAGDVVQRARHRALSVLGADARVAAEVEAAAGEAAGRAAIATAAELARHALALTPQAALEDRVRRAVSAARWSAQVGESAAAHEVLDPLVAALPMGPQRARCLTTLAASIGQEVGGGIALLREALAQPGLQPSDESGIRLGLSDLHGNHGDLAEARNQAELAGAKAQAAGHAAQAALAALYETHIGFFSGVPPTESRAWALVQAHSWDSAPAYDHPDIVLAWEASYTKEDQARAVELFEGVAGRARVLDDLVSEGAAALHRAEAEIRRGQLAIADALAEKGYRILSDGVRDQFPLYVRAHVAAWRGSLEAARSLAGEGLRMARETGDAIFEAQNLLVLGFTEVSAGRYDAACGHESALRELMDRMRWGQPGVYRWHGDAVEAFLGVGRVEDASDVAGKLWDQADRLDLPGCGALAARCDGLIHAHRGDLKRAQDSHLESLRLMDGLDMPLERGRSLLALGIARRRARQKATAREAFSVARAVFVEAGAPVWAQRVEDELGRTAGGRGGRDLTAGERSVAGLAASGATNREISAQLFLSPKTVEAVLTRVYRKLGVRSRTELARRLQPKRGE
jgi:DNA-binding CsgD family transcriptional regulator